MFDGNWFTDARAEVAAAEERLVAARQAFAEAESALRAAQQDYAAALESARAQVRQVFAEDSNLHALYACP